jgi:hypothetical protein
VVVVCLSSTFSLFCLTGWGCIYNFLCLLMAPVIYTSRYVLVLGHYWFVIPIVWEVEGHLVLHQVLLFLISDLLLKAIQNQLLNQYFNCNCYACKPIPSDLHFVWCRFLCLMESTGAGKDILFSSCLLDSIKILWTMSELNACWFQEILCLL